MRITPLICLILGACNSEGGPGPGPLTPTLTARQGHVMAYDEVRQQTLVFGGYGPDDTSTSQHDHAQLWAWNGTAWSLLSASGGPEARRNSSMAWDVARERVVLYGGVSGQFPNEIIRQDTWEWDGAAWIPAAQTGPPARVHQSMAYDRVRQRVVLYGGFSAASGELRDVWEWDGATWLPATAVVPADRIARNTVFDEEASALVLFSVPVGGPAGTVLTDTWNGITVAPGAAGPSGCAPPFNALVSIGSGGLLFVGCAGPASSALWRRLSGTWTQAAGTQPPARTGHALAWDRHRLRLVMFGGLSNSSVPLDELWEHNGTAWTQRAGQPPAEISVGGNYPTVVTMVADSCPGTVIQNNPTVITHTPGAFTFSLSHVVIQANGTLNNQGAFTTSPAVLNLGGTNYHFDIAGTFSTTGFDALVHVGVGDIGAPGRCGYTVRWQGTKQGAPNVIPG